MSEKTRRKNGDPAAQPPAGDVPDKTTLLMATGAAAGVALLVLVLFVLPAEYGIDPTGAGRLTGISGLYGDDAELALGGAGTVHRSEPGAPRNDTVTITLGGLGHDTEYKFHLEANQTLLYTWTATSLVTYDFHGDPDNPSRPGEFSSYEARDGIGASGSFQAPFAGRHGWYFLNPGTEPVTITLHTWGYYEVIGELG